MGAARHKLMQANDHDEPHEDQVEISEESHKKRIEIEQDND